jgi:molybdopterin converting factor small subunit
MANIHYVPPYNKITGVIHEVVNADSLRTVCEYIQTRYPEFGQIIVNDELTRKLVIMVDRRNALTLEGLDTLLDDSSEITILRYMKGG